jgi:hypothetical protein
MDETNPATAATRVAIECLTLWMEQDRLGAAERIAKLQVDPDGPGATTIITGLLNLSHVLVLSLAKARGAGPGELAERAHDILRDWSRNLPE